MTTEGEDPLAALMARYQAGDAAAFDEIYRLTADSVEAFLRQWTSPSAAKDLVQETYLRMLQARRSFRPELPFRPWLYSIARHVAQDARRTYARRWSKEVGVDELPEPPSPVAEPDVLMRDRLFAALEKLPPDQREAVWLSRVEGMTSVEIGKVVGASPGAVKVRIHRAGIKLREWLGSDFGTESEAS